MPKKQSKPKHVRHKIHEMGFELSFYIVFILTVKRGVLVVVNVLDYNVEVGEFEL